MPEVARGHMPFVYAIPDAIEMERARKEHASTTRFGGASIPPESAHLTRFAVLCDSST